MVYVEHFLGLRCAHKFAYIINAELPSFDEANTWPFSGDKH